MNANRKTPTFTKRASQGVVRGLLMLVIGAGVFYGLRFTKVAFYSGSQGPTAQINPAELPIVTPDGTTIPPTQITTNSATEKPATVSPNRPNASNRAGNGWLQRALVTLEQRESVVAEVFQLGWVGDSVVDTHGSYLQAGSGAKRKFSLTLQGRIGGSPTQLTRISDGRSLWTVLQWESTNPLTGATEPAQQVTKVDLRKLRRKQKSNDSSLQPGQASANFAVSTDWGRFGGVPMLLASLDESFDFNAGRRMKLRGVPVIALAGRWNPYRLSELAGNTPEADLPTTPPNHGPHHVVVVLSEETLFPMMIEYRSAEDPLSSPQLSGVDRLVPSRRPLLKIDFLKPEFNHRLSADRFAYSPASGDWQDKTDHELQLATNRREWRMAANPSNGQLR